MQTSAGAHENAVSFATNDKSKMRRNEDDRAPEYARSVKTMNKNNKNKEVTAEILNISMIRRLHHFPTENRPFSMFHSFATPYAGTNNPPTSPPLLSIAILNPPKQLELSES